jgi:hypothetical protein
MTPLVRRVGRTVVVILIKTGKAGEEFPNVVLVFEAVILKYQSLEQIKPLQLPLAGNGKVRRIKSGETD